MGIIIEVTKNNVYIKEEAVYYKISKELFTFKPQVGMNIKILKTDGGKIIRIILIKNSKILMKKTKSFRFLRIASFYSFILGILIFFKINERTHVGEDYFFTVFLLSVFLIICSLLISVLKTQKAKSILAFSLGLFYSLTIITGVVLIFTKRVNSGLIIILTSLVPIVFIILYFLYLNKGEKPTLKRFSDLY